jgi:predicted  nucleic acid-binding Zn-ribbon protein
MLDSAGRPSVHEQPRRVAGLDRPLGDELGRELVLELCDVHPALRVASAPMDTLALERAERRIADAAAGRPAQADLEAALERSREQLEALAVAAAELEASIPAQVGAAVRDGFQAEVLPVGRHIAEIRGLLNQAIRRLERLEGELLAERHARVDDLALLVDLVSSGWRGVDARLEKLEKAQASASSADVFEQLERIAAA